VLALEEPYRTAILLRYYRGMSAAQIARELGIPPATVRTRLMRALDRLRARLDRTNDGDGRSWIVALGPLCTSASAPITVAYWIGAGLMLKLLCGIALVAAVLVVAWPRTGATKTLELRAPESLPPGQLVKEHSPGPATAERATGAPARVAIAPEVAAAPDAASAATGLVVRAVRRDDGQPVPGVAGYLTPAGSRGGFRITWPEDGRRARLLENAESDAAGILRFDLPHGEPFVLHLRAAVRNIGTLERPIAPLSEAELREVLAEMPVGPDVHFVGRVVDDATGEPLGAVQVIVPEGQSSGGVIASYVTTMTDAGGYFAIGGLSWARQHAQIDAPGYGRILAVLVAGHDSRETCQGLRLQRAATLDVHVVGPGGAPLAVEVRATTGFTGLIRPRTGVGTGATSGPYDADLRWWSTGTRARSDST